MTYDNKVKAYKKLVADVKNCTKLNDCNSSKSSKSVKLEKCNFCNEVNLWSYWQGGINNLDADILLVGQDWGNFRDSKCEELVRSIKSINEYSNNNFKYPFKENPTDRNLCKLFAELGDTYIISESNNPKVFFTNLVLCYRHDSGISGGFRQRWARNCSEYFLRLVSIIQPKVIICLGRSVFDAVVRSFGEKPPKCDYNSTVSNGARNLSLNGTSYTVFPMAHCGVFGTNNRKDTKTDLTGMDQIKKDWHRIKEYL